MWADGTPPQASTDQQRGPRPTLLHQLTTSYTEAYRSCHPARCSWHPTSRAPGCLGPIPVRARKVPRPTNAGCLPQCASAANPGLGASRRPGGASLVACRRPRVHQDKPGPNIAPPLCTTAATGAGAQGQARPIRTAPLPLRYGVQPGVLRQAWLPLRLRDPCATP